MHIPSVDIYKLFLEKLKVNQFLKFFYFCKKLRKFNFDILMRNAFCYKFIILYSEQFLTIVIMVS